MGLSTYWIACQRPGSVMVIISERVANDIKDTFNARYDNRGTSL